MSITRNVVSFGILATIFLTAFAANASCVCRCTNGQNVPLCSSTLDLPPTNLSFHLKAMTHAGLVTATQEGRFQRYRANLTMMVDLVVYFIEECCGGKPELCGDFSAQAICSQCSITPEIA